MGDRSSAWEAADKTYQLHHILCIQCRAAAAQPGPQERCLGGLALRKTYLSAGVPPHFTWLYSQKR